MSVELSNQSAGEGGVQDALAEIRASHAELRTFIEGLFDRLDGLADGLLVQEVANRQAQRDTDRLALDDQIERLAALVVELPNRSPNRRKLRPR